MQESHKSKRIPRHIRDDRDVYQGFWETHEAISSAHLERCRIQVWRETSPCNGENEDASARMTAIKAIDYSSS